MTTSRVHRRVAAASLAALTGAASLAAAGSPPAPAAAIPACMRRALTGESIGGWTAPAPRITPAAGSPGTPVRVAGSGFPPGATIRIVALYAEDDCSIVGLGDQLLGDAKADPAGTYRITRPWPDLFAPLLGRGSFPPTPLPEGRYYVVAVACEDAAPCTLAGGSAPGGPFVLGRRDDVGMPEQRHRALPIGAVAAGGAGTIVIAGGLRLLRRLLQG